MTLARTIDLNCDLGEGTGNDPLVMPLISSANIASGGHAGTSQTIAAAVALARDHGVAIGCHPGHADATGFGRRPLPITPPAAAELIAEQLSRCAAIAGDDLRHVKLHGALYHQVGHDEALAEAVSQLLQTDWPHLTLFAAAGSCLADVAAAAGLRVAAEAFADRTYDASGGLVPRGTAGAVIACPATAAGQVVEIVTRDQVTANTGVPLSIRADTLCVHGDGPSPVDHLRAIRAALADAGIAVGSPGPQADS